MFTTTELSPNLLTAAEDLAYWDITNSSVRNTAVDMLHLLVLYIKLLKNLAHLLPHENRVMLFYLAL